MVAIQGARVGWIEDSVLALFDKVGCVEHNVSQETSKICNVMPRTGQLNHIKPANGVLVATVDCLQNTIVRAESGLGRNVAHAQEHLQDVGEAVRLIEVVGRTLVKGPLDGLLV